VNKLTPHSVGLDRLFDDMFRFVEHTPATNYPPYNIVQNGEQFQIEMALAGVAYEDLDITLANGQLIIAHTPQDIENEDWKYVHKGIAQRKFERKFTLAEDVVVNGARMENGMLYIELERIVPEEKKPRKIEIEYKS
jgi:molecular chaperone IbpA